MSQRPCSFIIPDRAALSRRIDRAAFWARYNKLTDIPENYDFRNIINMLMDAGAIAGDGSDPDGNDDVIDLSQDMVRMLIFNYRAGCYDEKIRETGYDPDLYK